jgi:hypothetical protein
LVCGGRVDVGNYQLVRGRLHHIGLPQLGNTHTYLFF